MNQATIKDKYILVVDDVIDNLRLLSNMLRHQGYEVRCTKNGKTALKAVQEKAPDLILLDIQMPEMNGFEICEQLKNEETTHNIPVIFLSAANNIESKVKGFRVGAVDYITKPFQMEEVIIRVQNQILLQSATQQIHRLNHILQEQFGKERIKNHELELINAQLQQEIAARKKAELQLVHDALHDSLTGLPNRGFLMDKIEHALKLIKRNPNYLFAVLFIDLNRFKNINDTLGHGVGDQLLIAIAELLQNNIREVDTVARLGGDEFIILLNELDYAEQTIEIVSRLFQQLQKPLILNGTPLSVGASVGIVPGSSVYQDSLQILRDADIAMYQAKKSGKSKGKNWYQVFDKSMYLQNLKHVRLENDLKIAIREQELELYYQPIISLKTRKLAGFEALIRWQHPEQGFIAPHEFIPIAQEIGLISTLGNWVLEQACQQLAYWQNKFEHWPETSALTMSINVANQQFQEVDFIPQLDHVLDQSNLDPSCIRLEITELTLIDPEPTSQQNLTAIQKRKIKLSIDDFGTGCSSVSSLRRLPIDNLKIDRSFIENFHSHEENLEIVKTIITLAHTLGMKVVAEGVKTTTQEQKLAKLGCEMAQGHLFAEPLSVLEMESMLNNFLQGQFKEILTC